MGKAIKINNFFCYLINDRRKFLLHILVHFKKIIKSDKLYVRWYYYLSIGKKLNLTHPSTYNEKLQWMKLHYHNPQLICLVDKFEVKSFVTNIYGDGIIIPTFGIYNSFDEIDFDQLPNQFVLKCTHDSGGLVICKDKSKLDITSAKSKINSCLKNNYYFNGREWPYKHVKPRILCEKYMVDESGYELKDYKFFCFDGIAKFLFVACDRGVEGEEVKFNFYDTNWQRLPIKQGHENYNGEQVKPKNFEKMIEIAEKLSKGFPHVRVDLYNINGDIYFGEFTFFHFSGVVPFNPPEWDEVFGAYIALPPIC